MIQAGEVAPEFELPDSEMEMVRLADFAGSKTVVLYFYPKDDTPGCTIEAIDFSERTDEFEALHTVVLGVSMDDCMSHGSFRDKHGLTVQLLADTEGDVCRRYDVLHEREVEGRKRVGIQRSTFIIDRKGVVRHALYHVNARGHAAEVLGLVRELVGAPATRPRHSKA